MIYLLFAVICGSLFSVIFKFCQRHGVDGQQVTLFNYITALLFSVVPIAFRLIFGGASFAPEYSLPVRPLLFACVQGVFFMLGFQMMDRCTWRSGVALTTASARASLVLPVLLSSIFLGQAAPPWLPVAGVLLAMFLIVIPAENEAHDPSLQTGVSDSVRRRKAILLLVAVFCVYGVSDFSLKLVQHSVETSFGPDSLSTHLSSQMCVIFFVAALCSLLVCVARGSFSRYPVTWKSVAGGVALGLVNVCCTSCMLRALAQIPTGLYYPLYNIGIVIVATIVGVVCFKERLKPLQIAGLLLAVVAIAFFFKG